MRAVRDLHKLQLAIVLTPGTLPEILLL